MAHLHKKMKKGRPYYYIRESKRINGKPTIVNQVYLGTADAILARLKAAEPPLPNRFASKEFGALFVLNELDRTSINLAWLIDDTLPKRRKPAHLSMGDSLYYTVLNRAIAPRSKRQLAAWYEQTDIQHIRPVNLKDLSSQAIWNQWNRLSETDLEHLSERFFEQVQTLLPKPGGHFLFDTTNFYTYLGSTTPSELAKRGYNKAGKHQLRQIGLALITERTTGVPIYYRTYRGNQHDARFFDEQLPDIVKKLTQRGLQVNDLTLIFDKGMTSEANITRLDAQDHLHFITSYSLYLAPDLARIPLKHFQPLACPHNDKLKTKGQNSDQILYLQRHETFWGQRRQVLITYNPKTFRKKRYELGEKLAKVRPVL
jgi:transposase